MYVSFSLSQCLSATSDVDETVVAHLPSALRHRSVGTFPHILHYHTSLRLCHGLSRCWLCGGRHDRSGLLWLGLLQDPHPGTVAWLRSQEPEILHRLPKLAWAFADTGPGSSAEWAAASTRLEGCAGSRRHALPVSCQGPVVSLGSAPSFATFFAFYDASGAFFSDSCRMDPAVATRQRGPCIFQRFLRLQGSRRDLSHQGNDDGVCRGCNSSLTGCKSIGHLEEAGI